MGKKVLVVDDDKEIVNFLERFLGRFNIAVIKATSGEAALDCHRRLHPQCVFLDIQMPGKDGITVLKELREIDPALKVIMITGREEKTIQETAKKYGAVDYITKPLDLSELSKKIEKYVL